MGKELTSKSEDNANQWLMLGLGITETKVAVMDILINLCEKTKKPLTIGDLKHLRSRFMEKLEDELIEK